MIIWSGLGILVVPIAVVCALLSMFIAERFTSPGYTELHMWPVGVGLLLAAAVCWFTGQKLRNWRSQTLLDPATGKEVVLRRRHSLFFVPMHWWAFPIASFGLITCFVNSTPEEVRQRKEQRAARQEVRRAMRQPQNEQRP